LRQFEERFNKAIEVRCAEKPRTVKFYRGMFKGLLAFAPLADTRLDRINEALIEWFVQYREALQYRENDTSRATVNRHLATLRRALRLAQEWNVINRVLRIRLMTGERTREFVLRSEEEKEYLDGCLNRLGMPLC
jgi:Phage integrase SAM-like domain